MTGVLSSAASGRLERLVRRLYGGVLGVLTIELWINQVSQREHFNSLSDIVLVALLLSVLAVSVSAWLVRGNNLMLGIHGALGLLAVLLIPAMSLGTLSIIGHSHPWVWWTVGLSAMSVAIMSGLRPLFYIYLALLLLAWQIVRTSARGGDAGFVSVLQDSFFVFFLAGGIAGLTSVVRSWAGEVDRTNSIYLASAIKRAKVDAIEREDQRINALIHDSVLHAFLSAAAAKTPEEQMASVTLASQAANKISNIESTVAVSGNTTPNALFRALGKAALKASPAIQVSTYVAGSESIPSQAAQAITEAALQAIENAIKHSRFTKLELKLNSPATGLVTVHVIDNGRGFSLKRVPRWRIGISGSIVTRMDLVGGVAKIKSSASTGTTVSLRWPK